MAEMVRFCDLPSEVVEKIMLWVLAIELVHDHAPFSRYPLMKVLLMTQQSGPPGLPNHIQNQFLNSLVFLLNHYLYLTLKLFIIYCCNINMTTIYQ
ncbi:hypothetical protein CsatB_029196 [Cannabis sativa]